MVVNQMVEGEDRHEFHKVFIESLRWTKTRSFKSGVKLGQEILLDVGWFPRIRVVFAKWKKGISPESGLQLRIIFANQVMDQWGQLLNLTLNSIFGQVQQQARYELQTGSSHSASVLGLKETPKIRLMNGLLLQYFFGFFFLTHDLLLRRRA